jgi:hypothetical protein
VRVDPVSDRLQRGRDPVLLLLEEIERNRASVVGLEQLLLFAFQLRPARRKVSQLGCSLGHHLVELGMQH